MKKIVAALLLCIVSTDVHSGRVVRAKRNVSTFTSHTTKLCSAEPLNCEQRQVLEVQEGEYVLTDYSSRGALKGHQGWTSSDEETLETETQPVSILELLAKSQSLRLKLKTYKLGLIFARSLMQPGYDVERAVSSLEKQEKSRTFFRESFVPDSKQKDASFIERCLVHDWFERNAAFRHKMSLQRFNHGTIVQEVQSTVQMQMLQERKNKMDQLKQNRKQEQKRLKQQSYAIFQKNKKLPKSQQQIKQIAHRKTR